MKQVAFPMTLSLLVLMFATTGALAQEQPAPVDPSSFAAVTPEVNYHFTDIVERQRIVHDFPIFNKGKAELLIQNVKAG